MPNVWKSRTMGAYFLIPWLRWLTDLIAWCLTLLFRRFTLHSAGGYWRRRNRSIFWTTLQGQTKKTPCSFWNIVQDMHRSPFPPLVESATIRAQRKEIAQSKARHICSIDIEKFFLKVNRSSSGIEIKLEYQNRKKNRKQRLFPLCKFHNYLMLPQKDFDLK